MAQVDDNKKLVESLYTAFARGDVQYILDRVTDDVEWVTEGPQSIPYSGEFRGRAGVQRFFEALSSVEGGKVTAHELIAAEDQVVGLGRFTGTVKATKQKLDVAMAHVFTVRGGKISRWLGYADTARVAEAYSSR
jgi:ketosteroid isomerase-like protein